jgi:adenylate cyclase
VSVEIERKFLVAGSPGHLDAGETVRQGYLALDGEVEVRVRERGGACRLTVKGGRGLARAEVEVELDRERFEELWPLTEGRRLEKRRFLVELDGETTAELDVYGGSLEGLSVVEVEFAAAEAADGFRPPGWFGEELTGDERAQLRTLLPDALAGLAEPASDRSGDHEDVAGHVGLPSADLAGGRALAVRA